MAKKGLEDFLRGSLMEIRRSEEITEARRWKTKMMMNDIEQAVYFACRDFSKKYPDIFVLADFDSEHETVKIYMEYTGVFSDTTYEVPKISGLIKYVEITSFKQAWKEVVNLHLDAMKRSLTDNFMLSRRSVGVEQ